MKKEKKKKKKIRRISARKKKDSFYICSASHDSMRMPEWMNEWMMNMYIVLLHNMIWHELISIIKFKLSIFLILYTSFFIQQW